jgi:hypothetical protein
MKAIKAVSIVATLLILGLNAAALIPAVAWAQIYLLLAALVLGLVLLVLILLLRQSSGQTRPEAEAARPLPPATRGNQAETEIVGLLASLQAKGRLIDFLMDDINATDDTRLAAASRVVHAGCKAVLQEHFRITPLRLEKEGTTIQVPAGYLADEYRLLGKVSGQAPFSGVLIHHGWKTEAVSLPRIITDSSDRLPTIAPAEVELK